MKVVYTSITKELARAIEEAERSNRRIEYIELTPAEWVDLVIELGLMIPFSSTRTSTEPDQFLGVPIRKAMP